MKIGVDLGSVALGTTGGLAQLLQGVLEALFETDRANQYLIYHTIFNFHLLRVDQPHVRRICLPWGADSSVYRKSLGDQLLAEGDVEVLFRAYPENIPLDFPFERQVVCIPDCQQEAYPEHFAPDVLRRRRYFFHQFQSYAGAIGVISEFVRRQVLDDPWTRCDDVFLMPPALPRDHIRPDVAALTPRERELLPGGPFFLYPANLWPHKNHSRVLEAFASFCSRHGREVEFIFTGHPDGWTPLQERFAALPIRHLGYVRPELLAVLYQRARALVYLSLFEGFGIPLLEAFAAGVPVLCGDRTSLPEVGGDAVLACDPTSVEEMAAGMERIAGDELRRTLVERGRRRLQAYTWEESARNLRQALERVAERARAGRPSVRVWTPPVVSIVTPSYNQGKFIRSTIDSVLSQDYPHIDYRVVDGGSTDETLDVLRSYGERFPWVSEKDRGQAHAINKGLGLARGQVLAYLNSDDLLKPGAVSRVVELFRQRPHCDLIYGRDSCIDAEGRFVGMFPTAEYSFERLVELCCISQPAAFWRDRIARLVGPFDERLNCALDYDYWLRIDRAGGLIEHVPDLLASTRQHPQTKTQQSYLASERYLAEVFQVCLKHAGYVSPHYIRQWAYEGLFPRHPWLERFAVPIVRFLQTWHHLRHRERHSRLRALLTILSREIRQKRYLVQGQIVAGLRFLLGKGSARPPLLVHMGRNNWVGPHVELPVALTRNPDHIRLAGVAACDLVLTVYQGKRELGQFPLEGGRLSDVEVPVPRPQASDPIILKFSRAVPVIDGGKKVSFQLHGTNLFTARDVA